MNSPGHLELLIDISCDDRSCGDGTHAMTRPEETNTCGCVCVCVLEDSIDGDAWQCGQQLGFGWSISGPSEIFIEHGVFTKQQGGGCFY